MKSKSFPLKLVTISICIIYILSVSAVSALSPDEASVTAIWANPKYYQGDTATVRIIFQNNIDAELEITRISIHFDWMPPDAFYTYDLSGSPARISGKGSNVFELTNIRFLAGASAGLHSYYISIDYTQNSVAGIWNSPSLTLQIFDGNEKIYYELEPQVTAKIDNATYSSTEAQSLLQQAKTEHEQAGILAGEGKWQEAVTSLRTASDYLDQAETAEQSSGQTTGNLLLYLIVAAVAVAIVLTIIGVAVRRKRKAPVPQEPDSVV